MFVEKIPLPAFSEVTEGVLGWIEMASIFVEVVAVIIILFTVIYGTINFIVQSINKKTTSKERFRQYKHRLGRALLLSLEILVAADVIRTVVLGFNFTNVTILGLLVVIRTFLSWSISVEMEGHLPWQEKNLK